MIFTEGAHQSAKCQENFNCSGEFRQICILVGSFCWKDIQFQLQKRTQELCLMIFKIDAKFEQKPICCLKIDKNLVNFDTGTQKCPKFAVLLVPLVPIT